MLTRTYDIDFYKNDEFHCSTGVTVQDIEHLKELGYHVLVLRTY